jgi:hypothetical protein
MTNNKAREINSPIIEELINETSPEELAKIDTEMTNNKQQTAVEFYLDKVFDIIGDDILDKLSNEQLNKIHDLSLQAKEMELTPIELPTDEEIKKEMEYDEFDPYDVAYFGGLTYMRNLIQGGNK